MERRCTRRRFLKRSAVTAIGIGTAARAAGAGAKPPPSDTITMGQIGVGPMGSGLQSAFLAHNDVCFTAICDVREPKIAAPIARCAKRGQKVEAYRDFRKLLDRKDLDAVIVSTPPHWKLPPAR